MCDSAHHRAHEISCAEIERLLSDLTALRKEREWIPCSERLPERGEIVLCHSYGGVRFIGLHADEWHAKEADDSTHDQKFSVSFLQPEFWQKLP